MDFADCDIEETDVDMLMEAAEHGTFWKATANSSCKEQQPTYSIDQDPCLHNTGFFLDPEGGGYGFSQPQQLPECLLAELNPADVDAIFLDLPECLLAELKPDDVDDILPDLLAQSCGGADQSDEPAVSTVGSAIDDGEEARFYKHPRQHQTSGSSTSSSGTNFCSLRERIASEMNDQETLELLDELMMDDGDETEADWSHALPPQKQQQQQTGTTSVPQLPLFEPYHQQQHKQQQQQQLQQQFQRVFDCAIEEQQLLSPVSSQACCSSGGFRDDDCQVAQAVSFDREAEIDQMAAYIKEVVEKSASIKPEDMSSKLKVHEVILTILLNSTHGNKSKDLRRILAFCDENGRESSAECQHFKTLDTETMGLLWQKIKGNKKASYDTFARAMRVRREKSKGYFDYLDAGKRSKKRIYRLGEKTMAEMARLKQTLSQFSEPQACGF